MAQGRVVDADDPPVPGQGTTTAVTREELREVRGGLRSISMLSWMPCGMANMLRRSIGRRMMRDGKVEEEMAGEAGESSEHRLTWMLVSAIIFCARIGN